MFKMTMAELLQVFKSSAAVIGVTLAISSAAPVPTKAAPIALSNTTILPLNPGDAPYIYGQSRHYGSFDLAPASTPADGFFLSGIGYLESQADDVRLYGYQVSLLARASMDRIDSFTIPWSGPAPLDMGLAGC